MPAGWNLLVLAFVLTPIVVVVGASFNADEFTSFPPEGFSLRWYSEVLSSPAFMDSFWLSVKVAIETAIIAMPVGLTAALAITRTKGPLRSFVQFLSVGPLVFPQVLLGLGLLNFFVAQLGLELSEWSLVAGHVLVTLPFVVGMVSSSLAQQDANLEAAAGTLGASPTAAMWHVTLPLVRPAVAASGLFVFIFSFDNVGISLFISVPGIVPLPIRMYEYVTWRYDPTIAAASTMLILISAVAFLIARQLVSLEEVFGGGRR